MRSAFWNADRIQGLIAYFERTAEKYLGKSIHFAPAVAQGDVVYLHTYQIWPGSDRYVVMIFFRFDGQGKIVEYWDALCPLLPPDSAIGNPVLTRDSIKNYP